MKLTTTILSVLAAVATTTTVAGNANDANTTTTTSIIQALPLNYTLSPNAVELLQANDLWAPDLAAFAAGVPNVDGVNITAEVEKFRESGLDANEIVSVSIDNTAAVGGGFVSAAAAAAATAEYKDCQQCDGCQSDCLILILFLPFYGA
ncbi:hypothetical protein VMCG_01599 [Cytospora schulzeri]|uniref:Uncharacterized protein n=1 Tax=Cytospora schulzeri TaxID=448051 RepID=A0A423X3G2_9PEZI|nr:hypothetical protein VMCG_01599 [Valsa malicola]